IQVVRATHTYPYIEAPLPLPALHSDVTLIDFGQLGGERLHVLDDHIARRRAHFTQIITASFIDGEAKGHHPASFCFAQRHHSIPYSVYGSSVARTVIGVFWVAVA